MINRQKLNAFYCFALTVLFSSQCFAQQLPPPTDDQPSGENAVSVLESNSPPAKQQVQLPPTPTIVAPPQSGSQPVAQQPAPITPVVPNGTPVQGNVGPGRSNANYSQGVQVGGPNAGVQIGGGEGLRIGTPNTGVQYGGGQALRYGTTNAGVRIGGGEGYRLGTPNIGVQYGGGQILRYGTPNAGVMIGNGEGFRVGTPNIGVQYGGGQILRWGTPNAGVLIGGGEGVRIGTSRGGVRFGGGRGFQIGRFRK